MEINRIYNEDCLITMAKMPDNFIDLTVTSPPYDNLRNYKGYDFQFEEIAKALFRVTKQGGVIVWVVGDATIDGSETGSSFRQALFFKDLGLNLHDTMIYASKKPPLTHNRYEQEFEYMFVFSRGTPNIFIPIKVKTIYAGDNKNFGYGKTYDAKKETGDAMRWRRESRRVGEMKIKGNIWEYATGMMGSTQDEIAFHHPAIFPERLASDHIESWSNEGDLVYDPMGGSGTTIKMAYLLNRNFVMSEISSEYCLIAERRLHDSQRQNRLCFPLAAVSEVL